MKAFQTVADDLPYVDAGLDKFLFMLPKRYLNDPQLWQQVMEPTRSGPIGLNLIGGMHRSIAALAGAGNNVVADHVLVDPRWLRDCAEVLDTSTCTAEDGARQLKAFVDSRPKPRAFRLLRTQ